MLNTEAEWMNRCGWHFTAAINSSPETRRCSFYGQELHDSIKRTHHFPTVSCSVSFGVHLHNGRIVNKNWHIFQTVLKLIQSLDWLTGSRRIDKKKMTTMFYNMVNYFAYNTVKDLKFDSSSLLYLFLCFCTFHRCIKNTDFE